MKFITSWWMMVPLSDPMHADRFSNCDHHLTRFKISWIINLINERWMNNNYNLINDHLMNIQRISLYTCQMVIYLNFKIITKFLQEEGWIGSPLISRVPLLSGDSAFERFIRRMGVRALVSLSHWWYYRERSRDAMLWTLVLRWSR